MMGAVRPGHSPYTVGTNRGPSKKYFKGKVVSFLRGDGQEGGVVRAPSPSYVPAAISF